MQEEEMDVIVEDNTEELTEEQLAEIERQKEEELTEEIAKQRNKEITRQRNKLRKLFPDINFKKDTDTLLSNLIDEASFMYVTLKHLKETINKKGVKEKYVNGNNQFGYKDSVEAKTYNAMIKNYISIIKQLNDELPKNKKINPEDEFDQFNNLS